MSALCATAISAANHLAKLLFFQLCPSIKLDNWRWKYDANASGATSDGLDPSPLRSTHIKAMCNDQNHSH